MLKPVVHPANLQDRDGALLVLDRRCLSLFPFLTTVFADGAYSGQKLARALAGSSCQITVVKRTDD